MKAFLSARSVAVFAPNRVTTDDKVPICARDRNVRHRASVYRVYPNDRLEQDHRRIKAQIPQDQSTDPRVSASEPRSVSLSHSRRNITNAMKSLGSELD
jgi:hypothetical protein